MASNTFAANQATWLPPEEVKDHSGNALPSDREFFAPPPAEIGPVISAWSTMSAKAAASSGPVKLITVVLCAAAGGGAVYGLVAAGIIPSPRGEEHFAGALTAVVVFLTAIIVAATIKWKHRCNYVGESGVAAFTTSAWRGGRNVGKREILLFSNVAALTTHQVRHYHNGVYTGTNYNFTWFDPAGKRAFKLGGSYKEKKGKVKPDSPFHLARSAEIAWSSHYLQRAIAELEKTNFATFAARGKNFVRVGPGVIEFHFKGEPVQMRQADLREVKLASGTMTFYHHDAKWFSSRGKFNLEYGQLTNARVFLLLLDKLMGYRF
jgi:hypothetical protein